MDLKRCLLPVLFVFLFGVSFVFGAPEPRIGSGFVYDDYNEYCLLFGGGYDTGHGMGAFDDMWALDSASGNWSEVEFVGGPYARFNFQMEYSRDHDCVVVFSGAGGGVGDTWEYDVATGDWDRIRSQVSPLQRGDSGFVYDEKHNLFIMYGGMSDADPLRVLNETWVYDPVDDTWMLMSPEVCPPRTYGCRFVYDSVNEVTLLWGGNLPGGEGEKLDDFWSYDYGSNAWTMIETEDKPPMRYWQYMAYDRGVGKVVVFGGRPSYDGNLGDTWLYDYAENQWTEVVSELSPSPRQSGSMVYDESIGCVVLFGGFENGMETVGETWVFDSEVGEWVILGDFTGSVSEDYGLSVPGFNLFSLYIALILIMFRQTRLRLE